MTGVDIVVGEELPPDLDAEGSLSLRLAMAGARHAHFGVLLLGFLTMLLAYISNAVLPMGVSIGCSAVTLAILATSLRRPAVPLPVRPTAPTGTRFLDWNAEVTSAEVALYGIVTVGLLTLFMAYLLNDWTLLGASVACTILAIVSDSRVPQVGIGLAGLLTLAIAYGMHNIVLFSFSVACTVVLLISLRMAGRERSRARGLDWNPDLSRAEMAQFVAAVAGLLALTAAYVLDSWGAMAVSLACAFLVLMGLLRRMQLGVVLVGMVALGVAWWLHSLAAALASIACSAAVAFAQALQAWGDWTRAHADVRARRLVWLAACGGLAALALAFYRDSAAWFAGSLVGTLAACAALARDQADRLRRESDARVLQVARSEQTTWREALDVAESPADRSDSEPIPPARPLVEALAPFVPFSPFVPFGTAPPETTAPAQPGASEPGPEVVLVPSRKVLDKAVRPPTLTAALRLDDEPSPPRSARGRRKSPRSPASRTVRDEPAATPSTPSAVRRKGKAAGSETEAADNPSPTRAVSPRRPASRRKREEAPAADAPSPPKPPSGRSVRPPSRGGRTKS